MSSFYYLYLKGEGVGGAPSGRTEGKKLSERREDGGEGVLPEGSVLPGRSRMPQDRGPAFVPNPFPGMLGVGCTVA